MHAEVFLVRAEAFADAIASTLTVELWLCCRCRSGGGANLERRDGHADGVEFVLAPAGGIEVRGPAVLVENHPNAGGGHVLHGLAVDGLIRRFVGCAVTHDDQIAVGPRLVEAFPNSLSGQYPDVRRGAYPDFTQDCGIDPTPPIHEALAVRWDVRQTPTQPAESLRVTAETPIDPEDRDHDPHLSQDLGVARGTLDGSGLVARHDGDLAAAATGAGDRVDLARYPRRGPLELSEADGRGTVALVVAVTAECENPRHDLFPPRESVTHPNAFNLSSVGKGHNNKPQLGPNNGFLHIQHHAAIQIRP